MTTATSTRRAVAAGLAALLATAGILLPPTPAAALGAGTYAATGRLSLGSTGQQGTLATGSDVAIDRIGRTVAFDSRDPLVPEDTNGTWDVYLLDRRSGEVDRASLDDDGGQLDGNSHLCAMTDNTVYVAFWSDAGAPAGAEPGQLFVRTRTGGGNTELVSTSSTEVASDAGSTSGITAPMGCSMSGDGRYVAFTSTAANLVGGDGNGVADVFRRDLLNDTTDLLSVATGGGPGNGPSGRPAMSTDASVIAFESTATNLVPGDDNGFSDIFARFPNSAATGRVSQTTPSDEPDGGAHNPSIDQDGSYIAFESSASNLVAGDTNGVKDVFVRRRTNPLVTRVSVAFDGAQATAASGYPDIDDDGEWVSFTSAAPNLYPADGNGVVDVFRRDLVGEHTDLVSRTGGIAPGNQASDGRSATSIDGRTVAFTSVATTLVRGDTNGVRDVFARDFVAPLQPFGSLDAFVTQQYADFVGRPPTTAERTEWKARLTNGELDVERAIDRFAHEPAWAQERAPVIRLYWAFFQRVPDLGGLDHWVGRLKTGKPLSTAATQFAASSEFQNTYGSLGNPAFVAKIYQNIFDRDPDASGLAHWTKKLDTKQRSRGQVVTAFSESSEGRRLLAPQTDIVLVHVGMLRTVPTAVPFGQYLEAVRDDGDPLEDVVSQLRFSPAYASRVTP